MGSRSEVDTWVDSVCVNQHRGEVFIEKGDPAAALVCFEEACRIRKSIDTWRSINSMISLKGMANARLLQDNLPEAKAILNEALGLLEESGELDKTIFACLKEASESSGSARILEILKNPSSTSPFKTD